MVVCGKIIQKKAGCSLLLLSVFDKTEYCFLIFMLIHSLAYMADIQNNPIFTRIYHYLSPSIFGSRNKLTSSFFFSSPEYGLSGIPIAENFQSDVVRIDIQTDCSPLIVEQLYCRCCLTRTVWASYDT